jgi:hypothetical protein
MIRTYVPTFCVVLSIFASLLLTEVQSKLVCLVEAVTRRQEAGQQDGHIGVRSQFRKSSALRSEFLSLLKE